MCNQSCIKFGQANLTVENIKNKAVLEVGSVNINGSLRSIVEALEPSLYIGVDIHMAPGVDVICDADNLVNHFGQEKFDVLISTEMLEHVSNWQEVVSNFKQVLKPNGILLITSRSIGFPYHGAPYDFWRYQLSDFKTIFSDFKIEVLQKDNEEPGVFLKAIKPINFKEKNLDDYLLYSIIKHKKINSNTDLEVTKWDQGFNNLDLAVRKLVSKILPLSIRQFIKKRILKII